MWVFNLYLNAPFVENKVPWFLHLERKHEKHRLASDRNCSASLDVSLKDFQKSCFDFDIEGTISSTYSQSEAPATF